MPNLPDTEKSYWREAYITSLYPKLAEDLEVDAVIVGAGITGLTTAYLLKQSGLRVAVLEKRTVGAGTTGRTTGKVTSQHNLIYADLQRRLGREKARLYGEANQAAIKQINDIITAEKISCGWQREDNYVYTADAEQVARFKQEAVVAAELGLPATFVNTTPLPFGIKGAVRFTDQATMHPIRYLQGLAAAVHGDGSYVFENSTVTSIQDGKPGSVKTKVGSVSAKDIVVATNVPTLPLMARGGYCLLEYPTQSYIVAGEPEKEFAGMYISPDEHHYSILPVTMNGARLLLVGGESNISGLGGNKEARYSRLAQYAEKHFGVTTIDYKWSDRDYLAYDGIPLVGKLYPWSEHLYVATAFMKWGLSNGTVAAMILRDLIRSEQNEWAVTFNSNRLKPIASIPRVAAKYILPG
ncbi:MAG: hypothetical protein JWL89_168 [Candidatus Saccharibacteria bacterium]|nr:hypothetical protein [Candidatus Saccharibacteria bacterium]